MNQEELLKMFNEIKKPLFSDLTLVENPHVKSGHPMIVVHPDDMEGWRELFDEKPKPQGSIWGMKDWPNEKGPN